MRELKFRAWHKELNRFAPDYAEYHFDSENSHLHFDVFNGNFDTDVWDFSECEIMQYTGLKDKNGVEIYEGDIVRQYEAGWNTGGIGDWRNFVVKCITESRFLLKDREVIGNIYENPELLEE